MKGLSPMKYHWSKNNYYNSRWPNIIHSFSCFSTPIKNHKICQRWPKDSVRPRYLWSRPNLTSRILLLSGASLFGSRLWTAWRSGVKGWSSIRGTADLPIEGRNIHWRYRAPIQSLSRFCLPTLNCPSPQASASTSTASSKWTIAFLTTLKRVEWKRIKVSFPLSIFCFIMNRSMWNWRKESRSSCRVITLLGFMLGSRERNSLR